MFNSQSCCLGLTISNLIIKGLGEINGITIKSLDKQ